MRFFIRTLGCKLNQLDSARLAGALARAGHARAASEEEAEWVLVNTCTVTGESDRKSRQAAHAVARAGQGLVVLGCSARVGFTADEFTAMKKGNKMTVAVVPMLAPDKTVTVSMSLKGFTDATDALKKEMAGAKTN